MARVAKPVKKVRVTAQHIAEARENAKKDLSPSWRDCESWTAEEFSANFHRALRYYNLKYTGKDLKPIIIKWMTSIGITDEDIAAFKRTKDWRCSVTMGAIASCLLKGMTPQRDDFNNGRDSSKWLLEQITRVITDGGNDSQLVDDTDEESPTTSIKSTPTIQERVKDVAIRMVEDIDVAIESFHANAASFDPKLYRLSGMLKASGAKPAHVRFIKEFYTPSLNELSELASGNADEQLREGYKHRSKREIRNLITFYQEIISACDMLAAEARVVRKPRARKTISKEQLVATLKYKKTDETLKLVSVDPTSIIGARELWIYNTKLRKLGKYVAAEFSELSVKGLSIINFDEVKSIQKTLRKPIEQLAAFKAANKVALRKFLDEISSVDTKLTGRLNEEIILLKTLT